MISVVLFDIFSFFTVFSIVFGQQVNWNGNNWANNCNFSRNDIGMVPTSDSQCGPACEQNGQCTHFTWSPENDGECWLKRDPYISKYDAITIDNPDVVCGVNVPEKRILWNGDWAPDCDFPYNDLKTVSTTAENCGPSCQATDKCTHFTYNKMTGICFLKFKNGIEKRDAQSVQAGLTICGIVQIDWHNLAWANGCNFEGRDVKTVITTADQCVSICDNSTDVECSHFTYNPHGSKCFLKYANNIRRSSATKLSNENILCGLSSSSKYNIIPFFIAIIYS